MTRALIKGEIIIREPFDEWTLNNLNWLIGAEKDTDGNPIPGDGWTLIEDYVPPADPEPMTAAEPVEERHVL